MISKVMIKKYCSDDISLIENYEKALNSKETFECHHRLETNFSDGTLRPFYSCLSTNELKALGMYYNRPANELIFLSCSEHRKIHKSEQKYTMKNNKNGLGNKSWKGKSLSDEHKKNISEGLKGKTLGKKVSKEARAKISDAAKGNTNVKNRHYYNNGKINVMRYECPEGFVPGRIINWKGDK